MKKIMPKNLTGFLMGILIIVLIIQEPLPIVRMLYRIAPVAQAEEMVRYFEEEAIMEAVELMTKSVVEIGIYSEVQKEGLKISQERGRATGMIVSEDGLILTNKHILNKGNAFQVVVGDTKIYEAQVRVKSPINDLALLKIEAKNLVPIKFGDSKKLKLGQTVLAIGYAKGEFRKTETRGVVSGLKRTFVAGDAATTMQLTELIQTDAMINEGSSGGPLINIKGEVVGMTTAMDTLGRAINFALPSYKAKTMVLLYKKTGRYEPGWLGVYYVLVDDEVKTTYNLPYNYGAYLTSDERGKYNGVIAGSPAEKAGLKMGDLILEVNSTLVDETNSLSDLVLNYQANQIISFRIYRNGITLLKNVSLEKWPEELDPLNP